MGWLELLRLFAEDQNRASVEANRESIQNLTEASVILILIILVFITLSIAIYSTYKSQLKKIKQLENSIRKNSPQ